MKLQMHPFSALAGAAMLGLVLIAASVAPAQGHRTRVIGIPDPRDIIVIEEGTPYLVPAGHSFVVTALGTLPSGNALFAAILSVDGTPTLQFDHNRSAAANGMQMGFVPPHLVVPAGSVIKLNETNPGAAYRAWGYLIGG